jgi:hypothetical protein
MWRNYIYDFTGHANFNGEVILFILKLNAFYNNSMKPVLEKDTFLNAQY